MTPRRPITLRNFAAAAAFTGAAALALICAPALFASEGGSGGERLVPGSTKPGAGSVLSIFDGAQITIVTDAADPAALTDSLLAGTHPATRHTLTVAEWRALPRNARESGSFVFLIDRQSLDTDGGTGEPLPPACQTAKDQVKISIARSEARSGRNRVVNHTVCLSAPDTVWLHAAVQDFRQIAAPPRSGSVSYVRDVHPLNVIALGVRASEIGAAPLLAHITPATDSQPAIRPNPLSRERWQALSDSHRLANTDEAILIDRSQLNESESAAVAAICTNRTLTTGDTVAWRERKPDGDGWRIIFCAPNAEMLAAAVRAKPDFTTLGDTPTVVLAARDLRTIRRVVVAGLKTGVGGEALANVLASRAATELRALDTFEVLERAGMNEILSEIALGQAGITEAKDRSRVRQLAAADAILIVEVTDTAGRTEYSAASTRLTAKLARPPKKPIEPSHLKYAISLPGKENDATAQALTDAILGKVVGKKSDEEYDRSMRIYARETLPAWQRQVDEYNYQHDHRAVEWQQQVTPHSSCTVAGSLRLVDLSDGLVMWESPFTLTRREDGALSTRTIVTHGEDSAPPEAIDADTIIPGGLKTRTAEAAVASAIGSLKATAMLPPATAELAVGTTSALPTILPTAPVAKPKAAAVGRIIDIDGDQVLVGIGSADGLHVGNTLRVDLGQNRRVALTVVHVRPRTCDCVFAKSSSALLTGKVTVGMSATAESEKREAAR